MNGCGKRRQWKLCKSQHEGMGTSAPHIILASSSSITPGNKNGYTFSHAYYVQGMVLNPSHHLLNSYDLGQVVVIPTSV